MKTEEKPSLKVEKNGLKDEPRSLPLEETLASYRNERDALASLCEQKHRDWLETVGRFKMMADLIAVHETRL